MKKVLIVGTAFLCLISFGMLFAEEGGTDADTYYKMLEKAKNDSQAEVAPEKKEVKPAENVEKKGEEKTTAPPPVAEKKPEKKEEPKKEEKKRKKYVAAAIKMNVIVPTGKVSTTWAIHGEVRYVLPWWNPHISIGVEAGYYPLSGQGQNIDPQIGLYDYSWEITAVPIYSGVAVDLSLGIPWIYGFAEGGFAAVLAWSTGESFNGTTDTHDVAYGYFIGGGIELRSKRFGSIVAQYRFTSLLLDFEYPQFNKELGDIGGSAVLIGYKYLF